MTFEKTWGILWSMANGCVDCDEDWCESHHDDCGKCRKEALENLKSAHDEEINHARKVEYHRGYEDGKKSMNAKKWQLDHDRSDVVKRLRQFSYRPCMTGGTQFNSSLLLGAVLGREAEPNCINDWWDAYDELVRLLATEPDEDPTCEKRQEPEIGTEESVPNLQESPDLTSCDELHRLLRKMLGEVKCVHDRLVAKTEALPTPKEYKELESCLAEAVCDNLMYRTMLNDAAEAYKRERDRFSENCEQVRDGWREIVRHCLDDAVMYCDLLNDAKEDYARLMDERDELNAYANDQHEKLREAELKIQQLESRCEMESNSCSKAIDERDRYKAACEAERDKLRRNVERFMLYGSKDYMELPKGEDGERIHMGDTVRFGLTGEPFEVGVITFYAKDDAFVANESNEGTRAKYCNHVTQPDPIEDTFREYELGNFTSSEAIERIREATNG